MIRKPNPIIVLLFIQIIPSLKRQPRHAYLHRSIDVKFIFDSARLGLFSSANILQITDVALRVVFLLFSPRFQLLFRLVFTLETSEMSAIFVSTTKTTQPRPQVFPVKSALTCKNAAFLTSFPRQTQNSSKCGHQQLVMVNYACAFNQLKNGEIF